MISNDRKTTGIEQWDPTEKSGSDRARFRRLDEDDHPETTIWLLRKGVCFRVGVRFAVGV
jgi:hypothetical protein